MKLIPLNTKNVKAIWGRVNAFRKLIGLSQSAYNSRVDSGDWFISEDGYLLQRKEQLVPPRGMVISELASVCIKIEQVGHADWHCFPVGFVRHTNELPPTFMVKLLTGLDANSEVLQSGTTADCIARIRKHSLKAALEGQIVWP